MTEDMTADPPSTTIDAAIRSAGIDADFSTLARALYSSDAGLYRVVPQGVAYPRDPQQVETAIRIALDHGLPITARGAGTSCAGNAVGTGLVIDMRRHLNAVLEIDSEQHTARVQPGLVQASLQAAARPHGLRFGPDPSTSDRCTIGGMIGNNACGPRALGYGRSADNVVSLRAITGTGEALVVGQGADHPSPLLAELRDLVGRNLQLIRTEFGRFSRQVSGYSLEHLLPENGFNVARFLAGTEGTLAVISEATVRLAPDPKHTVLVALGYSTMPEAADDAPLIVRHSPTAAEGLDRRIVDVVVARQGSGSVPDLPGGNAWVFVEIAGEDLADVRKRADLLLAEAHSIDGWVVTDPDSAAALWKIRADGAGLASVSLDRDAHGGWEDAAVPVEHLGQYLRDFDRLLTKHGLRGLPYGHFGEGCVHCRIDFPLDEPGGSVAYRSFVEDAAGLVGGYGGSLSGEHGDGRARSALMSSMYSPSAIALMAQVKHLFDPKGLLNPGIIVDPRPVDADMRIPLTLNSPITRSRPNLVASIHRCSGVGKCLADGTSAGRVMCPSYQATGEEKDSTRGRAKVLQEMINGELISGWDSPEIADALDLCLSCKGCSRDCPTGVDMAAYKSIALQERYRGRLRPRSHYALGWLPRWGRAVSALRLARPINAIARSPLSPVLRWGAGVDPRRDIPRFANAARPARADRPPAASGVRVAVWVDSFSSSFEGTSVDPLLRVLVDAGYAPEVIERTACCGLTWISTGQRDGARRQILKALDVLYPLARQGVPIVGLEPSCLAVWRSDAAEIAGDDPRTAIVAAHMKTLAEALLAAPDWTPPDLGHIEIVAQPHCHHSSVLGWRSDAEVLSRTNATVHTVGGCCGLAGNFGVERGHYEVSVAVAEHDLLPAVREHPEAVLLADGFSCRLQLQDLASREAVTLAELLAGS